MHRNRRRTERALPAPSPQHQSRQSQVDDDDGCATSHEESPSLLLSLQKWASGTAPFRRNQPLPQPAPSTQRYAHSFETTCRFRSLELFFSFVTTDVMDRLTVLRGKAMRSLYAWSCKRNYKTGYVWNDLSENDIVYPAEGAEYVLKASELVDVCSEKMQEIHTGTNDRRPVQEPNLRSKTRKHQLAPSPLKELDDQLYSDLDYDEVEDYENEDVDKPIYTTTSTTPHSRCSRGVSTEELPGPTQSPTESTPFDSSRLSTSKRFTYEDELGTAPSRNSVLMQFISCGGSAGSKEKPGEGSREAGKEMGRRTERLGRGVVCKMGGRRIGEEEMIKYMSENPRFGKLQTEEKEYFSGSIVESIREDRHVVEPVLKKSSSYNEEKSKRGELGEKRDENEETRREEDDGGMKGRCIPRMISAASALALASSKQPPKKP
ncbi:protein UPSTREAM OF FLC isoform X1 [Cucurbita maxima]|uniref:Protein UPSTREAM OF FLC isoform X1 n=1 Tax=Cucurbita maxima TaxID=3661 RepID=A0A6J1ISQ2_CUCMA|nr:protein UPSTREAM OF FLC isoform X1 [Cucurbita maxima]